MNHYWLSLFILPKKITKTVEKICSSYLWNSGSDPVRYAKVSWKSLCNPKTEGRLGLKDLNVWNKASIARQIWLLFQESGSL